MKRSLWLQRRWWIASTLIVLLILLLRVQVEWLWFEQFSLQTVLARRWLLQVAAGCVALLIAGAGALWRRQWLKLSTLHGPPSADDPHRLALNGWRFTFALLLTAGVVALDLAFLLRLAWLSWTNPFQLGQWWEQPLPGQALPWMIGLVLVAAGLTAVSRRNRFAPVFALGSLCSCLIAARAWGLWALALSIPNTGQVDPLLGADISFGLGRFSAVALLLQLLLAQALITVGTTVFRRLRRAPALSDWSFPGLIPAERRQLRPLLAGILALLSALLWLSRHQLLWNQDGVVSGAGWLEVNLVLPFRQMGAGALLVLALLVFPWPSAVSRRKWRWIALWIAVLALGLELLLAPAVQWLVVRPRELNLERPYLERSIQATRRAFQLDAIQTRSPASRSLLKASDLADGKSTLSNIRFWDSLPLLETNRQLQQLRVYYRFSSAAVDRYQLTTDDKQRQQVIMAARELDQAALPKRSRTWLNRHFVFTHGYGFTLSPVNTKAADNLPEYFISGLGPSARIQGNEALGISQNEVKERVPIHRAALYFGMLPSPYAVAPSRVEEFDYPEGDENIYNRYSGAAGVPLATPLQRLAASVYLREPRLLNTGSLQRNSKLLLRREVRQRVKALAPFLSLEGDPYLVSVPMNDEVPGFDSDQHQYWVVDGYTESATYPYASALPDGSSLRYIRNSVKAVVDAYNGSVHLYVSEANDPIIRGWQRVFPELFQPLADMPQQLRDHLMVPSYLFELQVQQLLRYHVTDPRVFYSGDDVWQVPLELYGKRQIPVSPYHITAQLDSSEQSEFLLLQPLTPLARPNLSAWLAARSDGEHYGEMVLLRFPSDHAVFGPEQVQAIINQDPAISQQFGLWDRAGSEVIQGNLLVLPISDALLYVEPVYLRATRGGLPTLIRVVVSDGRRVAMEATLNDALRALFGEQKATTLANEDPELVVSAPVLP